MTQHDATFTAAQIRGLEAPLLAAGEPLMQRASAALARHVEVRLASRATVPSLIAGDDADLADASGTPAAPSPRVALLTGGGDNGGDALFAGAELARDGAEVVIVPTSDRMHGAALDAALAAGARVLADHEADDVDDLAVRLVSADVIVDGILGIGSGGTSAGGTPALRGRAREIVAATRVAMSLVADDERPLVVAVDLPSGIDPDSGEVGDPDAVLAADLTVTFLGVKAGLCVEPGASFAGEVVLEDLDVEAASRSGADDETPGEPGASDRS